MQTDVAHPSVQIVTVQDGPASVYHQGGCCGCQRTYDFYKVQVSKIAGWLQIVLGLLCIIFQSVGIAIQDNRFFYENELFHAGAGIWCSVFFLVSGGLAVGAVSKAGGVVVASLTMSIFSAIFAFIFLCISAPMLAEETIGGSSSSNRSTGDNASLALAALLLIFSFAEIILTLTTSGIGCDAVCCYTRPTTMHYTGTTSSATIVPAVRFTQTTTYHTQPHNIVVANPTSSVQLAHTNPGPAYISQPGPPAGVHYYGQAQYPAAGAQQPIMPPQPVAPPKYHPASEPPHYTY